MPLVHRQDASYRYRIMIGFVGMGRPGDERYSPCRPEGTVWTNPFRVRVPASLMNKGTHLLEVKVTNVWNNRLVGDQFLPENERMTRTNLRGIRNKKSPLVPSGLLGPVTLSPAR